MLPNIRPSSPPGGRPRARRRPGAPASAPPLPSPCSRAVSPSSSVTTAASRSGGQVLLLDHARGSRRLQGAGVAALVIVGGQGEGDEHRRLARRGQLGGGGGAAAAEDEVGLREARLHVVEEGEHLRLAAGRVVGGRHLVARGRPRSGGRCAAGPRPGRSGSAAASVRLMMRAPWLPPKASRVRGGTCALRGELREAAAHRVARHHALAPELAARLLVRAGGVAHEGLEHAVREPRLGVGLEDDGGDAEERRPRGRSARPRSRPRRGRPRGRSAPDELDGLDHRPRQGEDALEHAHAARRR